MILKDGRISQVRKLVNTIIPKYQLPDAEIMITGDNTLVIMIYDVLIYTVPLINVIPGFTVCMKYRDIVDLAEDEYIPDHNLDKKMFDIYSIYYNIECSPSNLLAFEDDMRKNPEFEKLLSLKADDGAEFYRINGNEFGKMYFVPIFSGFPSMNKSDEISIYVYSTDIEEKYNLNVMNIYKKKINRNMKLYFRTLNLNKPYI